MLVSGVRTYLFNQLKIHGPAGLVIALADMMISRICRYSLLIGYIKYLASDDNTDIIAESGTQSQDIEFIDLYSVLDAHHAGTPFNEEQLEQADLSTGFLDLSRRLGARCVTAQKVGPSPQIAAYCFTAQTTTAIDQGWAFTPRVNHLYLYKCYTNPTLRGRGLAEAIINRSIALNSPSKSNITGSTRAVVCFVEWANLSSRRLFKKMGFSTCGSVLRFGRRHRQLTCLVYKSDSLSTVGSFFKSEP
jgi:GNAT superfamily N-acetyltransferase